MTTATQDRKTAPAWLKGTADIAAHAGVCTRTAAKWLASGLPARRLTARLILVRPADLDAFIEAQAAARASRRGETAA